MEHLEIRMDPADRSILGVKPKDCGDYKFPAFGVVSEGLDCLWYAYPADQPNTPLHGPDGPTGFSTAAAAVRGLVLHAALSGEIPPRVPATSPDPLKESLRMASLILDKINDSRAAAIEKVNRLACRDVMVRNFVDLLREGHFLSWDEMLAEAVVQLAEQCERARAEMLAEMRRRSKGPVDA